MKKTFKINHYYNIKHCLKATNIHVLVFFIMDPTKKTQTHLTISHLELQTTF